MTDSDIIILLVVLFFSLIFLLGALSYLDERNRQRELIKSSRLKPVAPPPAPRRRRGDTILPISAVRHNPDDEDLADLCTTAIVLGEILSDDLNNAESIRPTFSSEPPECSHTYSSSSSDYSSSPDISSSSPDSCSSGSGCD
jgi:hypothetical protein